MTKPVTITYYHVGGEQRAYVKGNASEVGYWFPCITWAMTEDGEPLYIWLREPHHVPEDIQ